MPGAALPDNESTRLSVLRRYDILDSASEADFDDLTKIAAQICRTPIALITLVDSERQWFKSRIGLAAIETPREQAFCAHAIHDASTLIVPDALEDTRFADNPMVEGEPRIRFYAGAPLQMGGGVNLGTLCVIDREPRGLSAEQQAALEALARQVVRLIELRHRNRTFGALVENSPAPMFVKDSAGRFVFVNASWKEHFGHVGEEPFGKTVVEWFGTDAGAKLFEGDVAALRANQPHETLEKVPSNSGDRTWLTVRFPSAGIAGETMLSGIRFDLTRAVVAEQRWRESEDKFAKLCVAAPDAIISADEGDRVVFWNRAAATMFGYAEEAVVGQPWSILVAAEDHARFADPERWLRRTTRHFTALRRDGTHFPAEVSLARWTAEGQELRTCFVRDLTERRQIESQLEQARRVESLGHVAATVAHEFNNVLMAIGSFNAVIAKTAAADQRVQRATAAIERSTSRAKAIVDQILHYSREYEPKLEPVELGAWLSKFTEEAQTVAGSGVTVQLEVPREPALVLCDVRQLEQVVANLVSNARDAMQGSGDVRVALELRDYCADAMLRDGERCARLTVSDRGSGMTEETLRRIFEPLFTTKSSGTGIGLALAQRLIEKHGGVLTATSRVGRGSDFVIHLPLLT